MKHYLFTHPISGDKRVITARDNKAAVAVAKSHSASHVWITCDDLKLITEAEAACYESI